MLATLTRDPRLGEPYAPARVKERKAKLRSAEAHESFEAQPSPISPPVVPFPPLRHVRARDLSEGDVILLEPETVLSAVVRDVDHEGVATWITLRYLRWPDVVDEDVRLQPLDKIPRIHSERFAPLTLFACASDADLARLLPRRRARRYVRRRIGLHGPIVLETALVLHRGQKRGFRDVQPLEHDPRWSAPLLLQRFSEALEKLMRRSAPVLWAKIMGQPTPKRGRPKLLARTLAENVERKKKRELEASRSKSWRRVVRPS